MGDKHGWYVVFKVKNGWYPEKTNNLKLAKKTEKWCFVILKTDQKRLVRGKTPHFMLNSWNNGRSSLAVNGLQLKSEVWSMTRLGITWLAVRFNIRQTDTPPQTNLLLSESPIRNADRKTNIMVSLTGPKLNDRMPSDNSQILWCSTW